MRRAADAAAELAPRPWRRLLWRDHLAGHGPFPPETAVPPWHPWFPHASFPWNIRRTTSTRRMSGWVRSVRSANSSAKVVDVMGRPRHTSGHEIVRAVRAAGRLETVDWPGAAP